MSVIHTNNITNKDGTSGPTISGITTVSSTGFMQVPVGDTRTRIVLPNENIVTDGLVLYLDAGKAESFGGDGTTWRDLSGNGNTGTLVNGVGYSGSDGGSLSFDGVNDYVNLGDFYDNTSSITINSWVYLNSSLPAYSTTFRTIISKGPHPTQDYGLYFNSTNNVIVWIINSGNIRLETPNNSINKGVWNNISVTLSTSMVGIYLNGTLLTSTNSVTTIPSSTKQFLIGYDGDSGDDRYWNGNISQVSIYNRALTPQEIQQNYNATKYRYEN